MYELVIGKTPFVDKTREACAERILTKEVRWPNREKFKIEYSDEFMDCVNGLLQKDSSQRLGT